MSTENFEDICIFLRALRREIASLLCTQVLTTRHAETRECPHDAMLQHLLPVLLGDVESIRRERLVGAGVNRLHFASADAGLIIIFDEFEPSGLRLFYLRVKRYDGIRQIIENGFERLMEQRQPMFHTLMLAAFTDGLIERIIIRRGSEFGDIARAETADDVGIKLDFAGGHQRNR